MDTAAKPAAAEKAVAEKAAAEKAPAKKKSREEAWLVVTGPARGRRRAGHAFGAAPVEIRAAELSNAAIAAIKGDPELVAAIEMRPDEAEAGDT